LRARREWHECHRCANGQLRVSPAQRRKVGNGPQPASRAAAEATLRSLDSLHSAKTSWRRVPEVSLHHPPGARSSRPVPHSPPTLARSGHPVGCHAARDSRLSALHLRRGERRASQQHGPRRAPPAPSLLPARSFARSIASRNLNRTKPQLRHTHNVFPIKAVVNPTQLPYAFGGPKIQSARKI
jgi:hypothetical protein